MVEIRIENKYSIFLPADHQIDSEFNHPFMGDGVIQGSYNLPSDIPYTPENDIIFKLASCIEIKNNATAFDAEIYINGSRAFGGKLILIDADRARLTGKYTSSFIISGFSIDTGSKKLSALEWPDDITIGSNADEVISHAKDAQSSGYPYYNYGFPTVYNPDLYGASNPDFLGFINAYDAGDEAYFKNDSVNNFYALIPFLYLQFVYQVIFKGYKITGSWFTGDRSKILLYNNYSLDRRQTQYYVKASQSSGAWSFPDPTYYSTVNNIDNDSTGGNTDTDGVFDAAYGTYNIAAEGFHKLSVSMKVKFTDPSVSNTRITYGFLVDGSGLFSLGTFVMNNPGYNRIIDVNTTTRHFVPALLVGQDIELRVWAEKIESGIWVNATCDVYDVSVEYVNEDANEQNLYDTKIHYANHVPDITVSEFLKAFISTGMLINIYPFKKEVRIDYIDKTFERTPKQVDATIVRNQYRKTFTQNNGYTFNFKFEDSDLNAGGESIISTQDLPVINDLNTAGYYLKISDFPEPYNETQYAYAENINAWFKSYFDTGSSTYQWKFSHFNFYDKILGNGTNDVKPDISPMMVDQIEFSSVLHLFPRIKNTGNSSVFSNGTGNKCPFKIFINWGFQPNGDGENYPFASSYNLNYDGDILGVITLRFDDDQFGILATLSGRWYKNLMIADRFKFFFDIDLNFLTEIHYVDPLYIINQKFIIEKIASTIKDARVQVAEIDFVKIMD